MKFSLGRVLSTPGVLESLNAACQTPLDFLKRHHAEGDWGEVCDEDKALNYEALKDGGRLLSAYTATTRTKIWVITESADDAGQRPATTFLLPEEY